MALILVIDDSATVRHVVRRMLTDAGHAVIEGRDGEVGLTQFETQRPAVVITDLFMPNREGIETIQQIRRLSPTAKIVAMSTSGTGNGEFYLGAARKLGADAILAKPFEPAQLLETVDRLLASARAPMSVEKRNAGPSDIVDPLLRCLYDYWNSKRRGRTMPSRADIDPLDLSFMLGQMLLIDVLREPLRFRIRVHGTELARRAGYELTGKMLDELPLPEYRALAARSLATAVDTRAPFRSLRDRTIDGRSLRYEGLVLPLSRDDREIDMLLVGMRYS